jgi:hypothetical protein
MAEALADLHAGNTSAAMAAVRADAQRRNNVRAASDSAGAEAARGAAGKRP